MADLLLRALRPLGVGALVTPFVLGLAIAALCPVLGCIVCALAIGAWYGLRWVAGRDALTWGAILFAAALVVFGLAGCAHAEPVHGPHWWNCQNVVCHQAASKVLGAAWDRNARACDCYIEDARHLPQWVVIQ